MPRMLLTLGLGVPCFTACVDSLSHLQHARARRYVGLATWKLFSIPIAYGFELGTAT